MIMNAQKRKLPLEEDEVSDTSSPFWESQRQFVFSVSLNKYQRGQELPEPSLRRSVLIANTLRQVSLEACQVPSVESEESQLPCSSSSEVQERIFTTSERLQPSMIFSSNDYDLASCTLVSSNLTASGSPTSCHSSALNVPGLERDEDWGLMSTDPDFSLSVAVSTILTALDSTIEGIPQCVPLTTLRSLESSSESSDVSVAGMKKEVISFGGGWDQQQDCRTQEISTAVTISSCFSDLTVEDLLQDIDISFLERDMGMMGVRVSGDGSITGDDLLHCLPTLSTNFCSPLQPLSVSLNQNQKCLPSFSSFSTLSSSSSSFSLSSPPFYSQNHKREGFDLEHLMEILVKS